MSSLLKLRRGSTIAHETFTGADGEVTFNTDTNQLVTHNGVTAGGFPHVKSADLAASSGSSLVGYLPNGGTATTVQAKLQEGASVLDFGAVGDWDGTAGTNNLAAFRATFAAHKQVFIPAGRYYLGAFATGELLIDLSNAGEGVSIITDGFVELVCNTTESVMPVFFYLQNNSHFSSGPIRFNDIGGDLTITNKGAKGFVLSNASGGNWGNVEIAAVYGNNLTTCVSVEGAIESANRIRGIHIGQLFSNNCYYGFNAQNQGDGVVIDKIIAYQNYRPYFVYGVTDHTVNIFNRHNRAGSGMVNISRSDGGLNTSAIKVRYVSRDQVAVNNHVLINHVGTGTDGTTAGTIRNITLDLDIADSNTPVKIVTYTGSAGAETAVATNNVVDNIKVAGVFTTNMICTATYISKGYFEIVGQYYNSGASLGSAYDVTINQNFNLSPKLSYTPTWTSTGTTPELGNGSLAGDFIVKNGMCFLHLALVIGSTTTVGTGEWNFSLPYLFKTSITSFGVAKIFDAGTAHLGGIVQISYADSLLRVYTNGLGVAVGGASPITWVNGDNLELTIMFPMV